MTYDRAFSYLCQAVAIGFWGVVFVTFASAIAHLAF